jgi:drug/metabolite transporter (DMT)-like permease
MSTLKLYALPLGAVLIWSLNTVVSKMSAGVIDPAAIGFFRWLIAGVLMAPFMLRPVWRTRQQVWAHFPKLMVLGLLGMVLYQSLAYVAARTTSATNMGLLLALMPLVAVGLAVYLLGERVTRGDLAGGGLSLLGLIYLLSQGSPARLLSQGIAAGDGLMLLACLSYAAYGVLLKRWVLPLSRWQSLFVQIWCANLLLFVNYLLSGAPALPLVALPLVLFAALPASVLAPLLWIAGVHHLGPGRTMSIMNLLPLFTVAIAVLFLGEPLHVFHLLGGGVALFGVVLAQKWQQPLRAKSAGTVSCA